MQQLIKYYLNVSVKLGEIMMESKQYRVKVIFVDKLENKKWDMKYKLREEVSEADILNTLCHKYLDKITEKDLLNYWSEVLERDID